MFFVEAASGCQKPGSEVAFALVFVLDVRINLDLRNGFCSAAGEGNLTPEQGWRVSSGKPSKSTAAHLAPEVFPDRLQPVL